MAADYTPDMAQSLYGGYAQSRVPSSRPVNRAIISDTWFSRPVQWARQYNAPGGSLPSQTTPPGVPGAAIQEVPFVFVDPEIPLGQRPPGSNPEEVRFMSRDEAYAYFWGMSPEQRAEVMRQAGLYTGQTNVTLSDAYSFWKNAVDASADLYATQGITRDPLKVMEGMLSGVAGGPQGPTTTVDTSMSTSTDTDTTSSTIVSSPSDARALLDAVSKALLGRAASKKEQAKFQAFLNEQERANPEVTNRTTTQTSSGTTTQTMQPPEVNAETGAATQARVTATESTSDTDRNVVQTGGLNRQQIAEEWAKTRPNYAEYQASKYTQLMMTLLGEAVNVGG